MVDLDAAAWMKEAMDAWIGIHAEEILTEAGIVTETGIEIEPLTAVAEMSHE